MVEARQLHEPRGHRLLRGRARRDPASPDDATPAALRAAAGKDLARDDLQHAFGVPPESVVLGCDSHCAFTQVGFCIAKDAGDRPTAPMPCTANVTTSDYDNGCVTRHCDRVAIPDAPACAR